VAKTTADVQRAINFVNKHKVRLTIINTGHDYHGRNDAPSGLSLDISQLRGVTVTPDFKATAQGATSPVPGEPVAKVKMVAGKQAAVTYGAGVIGSELNKAIKENGVFIVAGGACKKPQISLRRR